MNIALFNSIHGKVPLCQNHGEYGAFIEFAASYFETRGITRPVVVELGVERGGQKRYYEDILGAKHIGVDIGAEFVEPTVKADALDPATVRAVAELAGGGIDLLFIDLDTRDTSERAYRLYEPLTRHLVALHNSRVLGSVTTAFWQRLRDFPDGRLKVEFSCPYPANDPWHITPMGIGVIVKG